MFVSPFSIAGLIGPLHLFSPARFKLKNKKNIIKVKSFLSGNEIPPREEKNALTHLTFTFKFVNLGYKCVVEGRG